MKMHEPMKVQDLFRNLDSNTTINVCEYYNDSEEEYFKGKVFDCPWWIADLYIDTDIDGEGIYIGLDNKTNQPYLGIYVREVIDNGT